MAKAAAENGPVTYQVDPKDPSYTGRNVQALHNEFQMPVLQQLDRDIKAGNDVKNDPKTFKALVDALPEEIYVRGKNIKRPPFATATLGQAERDYLAEAAQSTKISSVPAKMLLAISDPAVTNEQLGEKLTKSLDENKAKLTQQTDLDLPRTTIVLKDRDGKVSSITPEGIDELHTAGKLSGEQRDFLKTAFNQENFQGGVPTTFPIEDAMAAGKLLRSTTTDRMVIDLSKEGEVKVYSSSDVFTAPADDPGGKRTLHSKTTLEVDISDLKGDAGFAPGMGYSNTQNYSCSYRV